VAVELGLVAGLEVVQALARLLQPSDPGVQARLHTAEAVGQVWADGLVGPGEVDAASSRISAMVRPRPRRLEITWTHHRASWSNSR
jgi:hypothetical protein